MLILLTINFSDFAQSVPLDDIDKVLERKKVCVTDDTLVKMADGTSKMIKNIESGDSVTNMEGKAVKVLFVVAGPEKSEMYKITFEDGSSITATKKHPFISDRGYFMTSEEITKGIKLKSEFDKLFA